MTTAHNVSISSATKEALDKLKLDPSVSNNDLIRRMVGFFETMRELPDDQLLTFIGQLKADPLMRRWFSYWFLTGKDEGSDLSLKVKPVMVD